MEEGLTNQEEEAAEMIKMVRDNLALTRGTEAADRSRLMQSARIRIIDASMRFALQPASIFVG